MLFFLLILVISAQDYCQVDNVITLNNNPDQCIQDGWDVLFTDQETTFIFENTQSSLLLELSNNTNDTIIIGSNSSSTLEELTIEQTISNIKLTVDIVNIDNAINIDIVGSVSDENIINTHGCGELYLSSDNQQRCFTFDYDEDQSLTYVELTDNATIQFTSSKQLTNGTCEPRLIAPLSSILKDNENGQGYLLCEFDNGMGRYGVCDESVKTNCECFYSNQHFNYPDCEKQSEYLELIVDGVLVINENAHWKSIVFTDDYGRIVVNNDATLTIDNMILPERLLVYGKVIIKELVTLTGASMINGVDVIVEHVTQMYSNPVYFIANIATPNGLKQVCSNKFQFSMSRYVEEDSTLECECHATDGEPIEEDCVCYWNSITATSNSTITFGKVYSTLCMFDEIEIGGEVHCDTIISDRIIVNNIENGDDATLYVTNLNTTEQSIFNTNVVFGGDNVYNVKINKNSYFTSENVTLSTFDSTNGNITIMQTVLQLEIDHGVITSEQIPLLSIEPNQTPLKISWNSINGNGVIAYNTYRPITLINQSLKCNNQIAAVGTVDCTDLGLNEMTCIAIGDNTYTDANNNEIYCCPCDNSIKCVITISDNYSSDSYEIEKVPTQIIIEKSVVLEANKSTINLVAQQNQVQHSAYVDPITVGINGNSNVISIGSSTDSFEMILNTSQQNTIDSVSVGFDVKTSDGKTYLTFSDEGCISLIVSDDTKCTQCTSGMVLAYDNCYETEPNQNGSESDEPNMQFIVAISALSVFVFFIFILASVLTSLIINKQIKEYKEKKKKKQIKEEGGSEAKRQEKEKGKEEEGIREEKGSQTNGIIKSFDRSQFMKLSPKLPSDKSSPLPLRIQTKAMKETTYEKKAVTVKNGTGIGKSVLNIIKVVSEEKNINLCLEDKTKMEMVGDGKDKIYHNDTEIFCIAKKFADIVEKKIGVEEQNTARNQIENLTFCGKHFDANSIESVGLKLHQNILNRLKDVEELCILPNDIILRDILFKTGVDSEISSSSHNRHLVNEKQHIQLTTHSERDKRFDKKEESTESVCNDYSQHKKSIIGNDTWQLLNRQLVYGYFEEEMWTCDGKKVTCYSPVEMITTP
ncbi:Uncharacterized protein QTN25_007964 [Entamoeba marina]